jgi:ABC-type polysaccharide/polyol phosphate export permease
VSRSEGRLRRVWRYRELLHSLVVRNLKVKYQRSLLGFVWTLVNPLLTVAVLGVVFSHVVRIPLPHYWAFLLSGYFVWNFALQTLNTGTYIFAEHSRLTRSVAFPSEILVFGASGSRLIEFTAEIGLVLAVLAVFHHQGIPGSYALLPVLMLIQLLLVIGIALPIATLSVFYPARQWQCRTNEARQRHTIQPYAVHRTRHDVERIHPVERDIDAFPKTIARRYLVNHERTG